MDTHTTSNEIQIELTDEVAQGTYVNLAVIAHSEDEFVFDFIRLVPGVPKAKVKCRLIMTPSSWPAELSLRTNAGSSCSPSSPPPS